MPLRVFMASQLFFAFVLGLLTKDWPLMMGPITGLGVFCVVLAVRRFRRQRSLKT